MLQNMRGMLRLRRISDSFATDRSNRPSKIRQAAHQQRLTHSTMTPGEWWPVGELPHILLNPYHGFDGFAIVGMRM